MEQSGKESEEMEKKWPMALSPKPEELEVGRRGGDWGLGAGKKEVVVDLRELPVNVHVKIKPNARVGPGEDNTSTPGR